jgi:hypothetical protein
MSRKNNSGSRKGKNGGRKRHLKPGEVVRDGKIKHGPHVNKYAKKDPVAGEFVSGQGSLVHRSGGSWGTGVLYFWNQTDQGIEDGEENNIYSLDSSIKDMPWNDSGYLLL